VDVRLSPPPPGIFVELVQLRHPLRHRIADDGRYLVTPAGEPEREEPVEVAWGKYRDSLAPEALERLHAAVDASGFFDLPAELPTPAVRAIPLGGGPLQREPLAVGVRIGDRAHVVQVEADPGAPRSAGTLEPLLAALWHELLAPRGRI
jgi:hypothetical protein